MNAPSFLKGLALVVVVGVVIAVLKLWACSGDAPEPVAWFFDWVRWCDDWMPF